MFINKNVVDGVKDTIMKAPLDSEGIYDLPVAVGEVKRYGLTRVSRWSLTDEERKHIADGGDIYLWIFGFSHPPVYVSGNSPSVLENEENKIPVLFMN